MEEFFEGRETRWDIDSVKEYISQFDTVQDFYDSPEGTNVAAWISNKRTRTGDPTLTMQNMLSGLREKENKQITEKLKEKYPDFNFENVTYDRDKKHHKTIKGLKCDKKDQNGIVHGEIKETRLDTLTQNSCQKCYNEYLDSVYPRDEESKIQKFMSTVPEDCPLEFNKQDFFLVPRNDGSDRTRLYVKNIKCKNHETPEVLFPKGTRADMNNLKFACPVCNDIKGVKWKGEYTLKDSLTLSGYTFDEEVKIGAYSVKGTGKRNRLKADTYFEKADGTKVIAEFDGEQHFFPKAIYRGLEGFEATVQNDIAKNKFCKENGIKLIRIGYKDIRNISSELAKALSMDPMPDLYLSTKYPALGWNDPTRRAVPIEISELKVRKDYVLTESQLKRIVEQTSNERLERIIKEFIMSKNDNVLDVTFNSNPRMKNKMIEIIFDKKKLTMKEMYFLALEAQRDIENILPELRGSEEPYELTYSAKTVED